MLTRFKEAILRIHRSEQGAEGLEKLLIIAAIVIPLLGVLIYYQRQIRDWVSGNWDTVKNDADTTAGTGSP